MFSRYARRNVEAALADTRVVLLEGPRQSGKTTLVKSFEDSGRRYLSLDDAATRALAISDPVSFIRNLDRAIIDEVQRAPDLLLAIKSSVDSDGRPGRFLLTGSANLMSLSTVADSLAGRMEILPLLPLAQAEIFGSRSTFLENVFCGVAPKADRIVIGQSLIDRVLQGGYPEAVARTTWDRRYRWQEAYTRSLILRDVQDVAQIQDLAMLPRLVQVLAEHSAQLVNYSRIGALLNLNHKTTQRYLQVLEQIYLLKTLPPWSANRLTRLVKSPKVHFLDTGVLAAMLDLEPQCVGDDRTRFGPVLETFVFAEISKLCSWHPRHINLFHFRDKDQSHEVDIVMEGPGGAVVGIEVKAAATASARDFKGLAKLASLSGSRFKLGLLLYDHDVVLPFADKLFAAPLSCLWS